LVLSIFIVIFNALFIFMELAIINKKRAKFLEISKHEKVHLRLTWESFSVTEHLDHVPIVPKNEIVTQRSNNNIFHAIKDTLTPNRNMKLWKLDPKCLINDFDMLQYSHQFNVNKQNHNKTEIWVGKSHENISEEMFREHYGNLTSTVSCCRKVIIFSETDTHYKLTTYVTTKIRLAGFRYYKTSREITGIILNKKTGDVYLRKAIFRNRKWKITITRNSMSTIINNISRYTTIDNEKLDHILISGSDNGDIIETIFNHISDVKLKSNHVNKIISVLGVDLSPYYDCLPYPYSTFKLLKDDFIQPPTSSQALSITIVLWFLKSKGIKYPNNPFNILSEHYPTIKVLRKNDMNLTVSILKTLGIKCGYTVKVINQYPEVSCFNLAFWYHFLGHNYFTQLNPKIFWYQNSIKYEMQDVLLRFGIEFEKLTDMFNNAKLYKQINLILSKREKYHIFCILRAIEPDEIDTITLGDIADHLKFKNELAEFNDDAKMKAKTVKEFQTEHRLWADKIHHYKKDKIINYSYDRTFIENIEIPHIIADEFGRAQTFHPVILKNDFEYEQESLTQKHCVKTYINNYNSIIISIRKEDTFGDDRVTCEFKHNSDTNTFKLIQSRGKTNSQPKDEFKSVLDGINKTLTEFARKHRYTNPTVIETNKFSKKEKILNQNNTDNNLFDF